jgi:hypothetical protein
LKFSVIADKLISKQRQLQAENMKELAYYTFFSKFPSLRPDEGEVEWVH